MGTESGRASPSGPRALLGLPLAACAFVFAGPAEAQPTIWVEHGHVGPTFTDRPTLALSGATLAVGRPSVSNQTGAVHLFDRVGATYAESAVLPSPSPNVGFGEVVALASDTLAVGIYGPPRVLLYRRENGGWTSEAQIDVSPLSSVERVAVDVSTLAVRDPTGLQIYAFDGALWALSQTVALPPGAPGGLAFDSGRLFVGVPFEETLGVPTGAVHVFEPVAGTWTETQVLTASDAADFDSFGIALAAEGDRLVVGSFVNTHAQFSGAAYVFERGPAGFEEVARLTGADPTAFDKFGESVALRGDVVAVAAPLGGFSFGQVGEVTLFERGDGSWPRSQILSPQPSKLLHFGRALAFDGDALLVADEQTGVWFYPAVGAPCTADGECGTGVCADGVCCDAPCGAQCKACDVPTSKGLCSFVVGAPHPGHEPCSASCQAGVATSAGSCVGGESLCVGGVQTVCEPYACGETACLTSCARDADCKAGFRCDTGTSTCLTGSGERCDDEHSLVRADGAVSTDCTPYRCAGVTCLETCATSGDCVEGFACDSSQRCVAVETAETGCSCNLAGASAVRDAWWLAFLLASLTRRRRCSAA